MPVFVGALLLALPSLLTLQTLEAEAPFALRNHQLYRDVSCNPIGILT